MRNSRLPRGLFAGLVMLAAPAMSWAQIGISITIAPPVLPVYVQPPCPVMGYLWTPGYWAYGPAGYYWVPGVWISPPRVGLLWTPGYWGFAGGFYGFHAGYWGPHVGFYGGVNYGFGYGGAGFVGGAWRGNEFAYNTAVVNVDRTVIHNTYEERVVVNNANHASFNGPGGINARPSPQEESYGREPHFQATANQVSHERAAAADRGQLASVNHGRPGNMAMARPMAGGGAPMNRGASPQGAGPMNRPVNNGVNNRPQGNAGQSRPMEASHANGTPNGPHNPPVSPNNAPNNAPRPQVANQKSNPGQGGGQGGHAAPPHRSEKPEGKEK